MEKEKGLQDFLMNKKRDMEQFKEEYEAYLDRKKANWNQAGITAGLFFGLDRGVFNFANGGKAKDNIPALLIGGEYVMSRDAVQKYGTSTFNKLNSGQIPRFADGGLVGDSGAINNDSTSAQSATNNVNITVNIDNNGSVSTNMTQSDKENVAGSQRDESKKLAKTIESAVLRVLVNEKKQGGMLN